MHTITHKANSKVRPLYLGIARPDQLRDFCLTRGQVPGCQPLGV